MSQPTFAVPQQAGGAVPMPFQGAPSGNPAGGYPLQFAPPVPGMPTAVQTAVPTAVPSVVPENGPVRIAPRQAPKGFGGLDSATLSDARAGDYVLRPDVPAMLYSVSESLGGISFRILPMPDYANPSTWHPYFLDSGRFGWWSHPYNLVWAGLESGNTVTYLESDALAEESVRSPHPYSALREHIVWCLNKNNKDRDVFLFRNFPNLVEGWPCQMPPVSRNYFLAAAIYRRGNDLLFGGFDQYTGKVQPPRGLRENEGLVLLRLSKSAAAALLRVLRTPATEAAEVNSLQSLRYGDMLHPQEGGIVTIFNRDEEPELQAENPAHYVPRPNPAADNRGGFVSRLEARVDKQGFYWRSRFYQVDPRLTPEQEQLLMRKWEAVGGFLEDCFYVAPDEQQAVWVARAFSALPEQYFQAAWSKIGCAHWLTDEVLKILRNRVTVAAAPAAAMSAPPWPPAAGQAWLPPVPAVPGTLPVNYQVPAGFPAASGLPQQFSVPDQPRGSAAPPAQPGQTVPLASTSSGAAGFAGDLMQTFQQYSATSAAARPSPKAADGELSPTVADWSDALERELLRPQTASPAGVPDSAATSAAETAGVMAFPEFEESGRPFQAGPPAGVTGHPEVTPYRPSGRAGTTPTT